MEKVHWVTTQVDPPAYYELLTPYCDEGELHLWSTQYVHVLEGDNPVLDFTSSTALGPYVNALGGADSHINPSY